MTRSDQEVTSIDGKSRGSGCRRPKTRVFVQLSSYKGELAGGGIYVTGNEVT